MIGAGVLMILGSAWGIWLELAPPSGAQPLVPPRRAPRHRAPGRGQRLRLDLHRGGPAALDRLRAHGDGQGVSTVSAADVAGTLAAFVAVYSILAVLAAILVVRAARHPLDRVDEAPGPDETPSAPGLVY